MPVSQPSNGLSIDLAKLSSVAAEAVRTFASIVEKNAATAKAFGSFAAFVKEGAEREDQSPEAFADFEVGLEKRVAVLCCTVVGGYIEDRDERSGPIRKDGKVFYRAARTQKTIHTLFGPVRFFRTRYRSEEESFSPVDDSLGLVDGYLTNPAAYRSLLFLNHCTPRETAKLFGEIGGMNPSSSHLKRLLETAGGLWKEKEKEAMDKIREAETVPEEAASCTVSLDGVMVSLRPDGDEEACWREASCGTVSFHDADGTRLKTLSFGRMPEAGKETLKAQLAEEVAHIRKVRPDLQLVAVADAAPDNWTFLEKLRPDERAVDFFHACEHLSTVSDHAVVADWYEKYRVVLCNDADGIDKVIRAIRYLRDKATTKTALKVLDRELRFFRKNRRRMRYANLKAKGYAIGSGVVEAANKVLVNQRMKRAGMRWSIEGGQNVLTFRALIRSDRFDLAWQEMTEAANENQALNAIAA